MATQSLKDYFNVLKTRLIDHGSNIARRLRIYRQSSPAAAAATQTASVHDTNTGNDQLNIQPIYQEEYTKCQLVPERLTMEDQTEGMTAAGDDISSRLLSEQSLITDDTTNQTATISKKTLKDRILSFKLKEKHFRHDCVHKIVNTSIFRVSVMIVIYLNCIIIGIQTERHIEENYNALFVTFHYLFLILYMIEISAKLYSNFYEFWKSGWNVLDAVIIGTALFGPILSFINGTRYILRLLRMILALRSIRSITSMKGLKIVVHSVVSSIPDTLNILFLLLIIMIMFSNFGVYYFGKCTKYFNTFGSAMLSLFTCFTQDGWTSIMIELQGCGYSIFGPLYIAIFIILGSFILGNLVVATIVINLEASLLNQETNKENDTHNTKDDPGNKSSYKVIDTANLLGQMAARQQPIEKPILNVSVDHLEKLFFVLGAIEENLKEFNKIQKQVDKILDQIKALSELEEVSSMASHNPLQTNRSHQITTQPPVIRRQSSLFDHQGDALSALISLSQNQSITASRVTDLNTLITHLNPSLVSPPPSPHHSPPPSPAHVTPSHSPSHSPHPSVLNISHPPSPN